MNKQNTAVSKYLTLPIADLIEIETALKAKAEVWSSLQGRRVFVTGGTGFFGKWMLESFSYLNEKTALNTEAFVLARNPKQFIKDYPAFSNAKGITFIEGDIGDRDWYSRAPLNVDYIMHLATTASARMAEEEPLKMLDTIVGGTRNVMDYAIRAQSKRFLLASSGAVYGRQLPEVSHVEETCMIGPNVLDPRQCYGEGKRMCEQMLASLAKSTSSFEFVSARCFAFVGPHLPLDTHFAIGNFIGDVLNKRAIVIGGDGTPYRSYMYPTDLVVSLIVGLVSGKKGEAYNVGSDEAVSIRDLATLVAEVGESELGYKTEIQIKKNPIPGQASERYVPSISKARQSLGLGITVTLKEAIRRTILNQ